MRPLPIVIGTSVTLLLGGLTYGAFQHLAPAPTIVVERGVLTLPPEAHEAKTAGPTPTGNHRPAPTLPLRTTAPDPPAPKPRWTVREMRSAGWVIERTNVPYLPPVVPPPPQTKQSTPSMPPARQAEPPATDAATARAPQGEQAPTCAECGAKAEHTMRREGVVLAFCGLHLALPTPPAAPQLQAKPPHEDPKAVTAKPAATAPSAPTSSQCQGLSRTGIRCRRKTRDLSGYCHQHRAKPAPANQ